MGRGGPAKSVIAPHMLRHGLPSHDRRDCYKSHYCTPAARPPEANVAYIDALHNDKPEQGQLIRSPESISCRLACDDREGRPLAPSLFSEIRKDARASSLRNTLISLSLTCPKSAVTRQSPEYSFQPSRGRGHVLRLIMRVSLTISCARLVARNDAHVFRAWPVGKTDTHSSLC